MHISEGVLSAPVLAGGIAVAACALGYSLKRLPWDDLMPVSIVASVFFVASLVHIPIGPASVHLVLNGLLGALLGWSALPAIAVALVLQALLFQFGGLVVLGANVVVMGLPAVFLGMMFRPLIRQPGKWGFLAAFACGALTPALSCVLLALSLTLSGEIFMATATAVLLAHIPVCLVEGVITAFICRLLLRARPDLFTKQAVQPSQFPESSGADFDLMNAGSDPAASTSPVSVVSASAKPDALS